MSGTIYQAAAGALMQQMRLDVLSNNLANSNTSGFKADIPIFRILPEETPTDATQISLTLSPLYAPMEAITDFSGGAVVKTGNPLDAAIVGDGFFKIQTDNGVQYTRNGSFTINENGVLCTAQGSPVMGQSGEISIDGNRVEIGDLGEVYVDGDQVDRLQIVDFPKPYMLKKNGETQFSSEDLGQESIIEDSYHISQGFVEASNVNIIQTMTEMIETLRVFESYQRVIQSADDTLAKTVNEVGTSA